MSNWQTALKTALDQAGDQAVDTWEKHAPEYPLIMAALEAVRQELEQYRVYAQVTGSHTGIGGMLGIWDPKHGEFKITVGVEKQEILIIGQHPVYGAGIVPLTTKRLPRTETITQDDIALAVVNAYRDYLTWQQDGLPVPR